MHIPNPDLYDDEISQETDGTWTVKLSPWFDEPIKRIPDKQMALEFCHASRQAMARYAANAMTE